MLAMNRFLRNCDGFSLIQGMIISAVVAGSGLVITKLITDQKLAQVGAETRTAVEELHEQIEGILSDRQHCSATILNNTGAATNIVTASPVTLNSIWQANATSGTIVVGNSYIGNSVLLKSMVLSAPTSGTRTLTLTYERLTNSSRTKQGYGAKQISKSFTLRVQQAATSTTFVGCYIISLRKDSLNSTSSQDQGNDITKEMCNELSATASRKAFRWDEAKSMCLLETECPTGQIYSGIDSSGDVKCRNIEEWVDFNQVIDTNPTTCALGKQVRFKIVGQKVKIECDP